LYNSPRQATIRADSNATLFSLDRKTYKFIVAQSSSNYSLEIKKALAKVPLLADLTEEQLEKLSDTVEIFPYNAGDVIIKKGAEGNVFYIVKEGTVSVTEMGAPMADHTLSAGDYFGEHALLTEEPHAATITALTAVKVMALDRESFNSLLGPLCDVLSRNMNLRILNSITLFEKLSKFEKRKLVQSLELEKFAAGVTIIKQGELGESFYIIKEGNARVMVNGHEVSQLKAGMYFGEIALLDDAICKASVITIQDCECFVINREKFTHILGSLQHILLRETQQRMEV
jgi:CRP-like cAMP-binding protein